ncbi:hypothetical protein ABBQ38_004427 [Trebouxia sp. C0009 RCD-2024]
MTSEADCSFVRQVLYGTTRYQALLKCFVDAFYQKNRQIVKVADPEKMRVFLEFVTDTDTLVVSCRDGWLSIYDQEYVDGLLADIVSFQPELQQLLQQLHDQAHLAAQASEAEACKFTGTGSTASRKKTKPEPFNLTQPKPKLQPIEEPLPPPIKSQPAPAAHQGPTKEERAIEAAKQRNKHDQLQRFTDPAHGPFHLRTSERPTNTQLLKQQQEEELAKQLTLYPGKPKPAPGPPAAHVRLNAAAILREDTLYRRKQLQEAQMIKRQAHAEQHHTADIAIIICNWETRVLRYEAELRDSSKHDSWQREAEAADLAARAVAVRKRRDDMAATQEAAMQARHQLVLDNLQAGHQVKEQGEADKAKLKQQQEEEVEAKRRQRNKVQAEKALVEAALERLELENRERAEGIRLAEAAAAKSRAAELAVEDAKKRDIILQLRALEKVPRRSNEFDPSESGGHNLLEEMSLLELRQRLAATKQRHQEEEDQQRAEIFEQKREKEGMLARKAANITSIRRIAAAQATARRQLTKQQQAAACHQAQARVEEQAVHLHEKLEAKRAALHAEKERLAAEEKRIKFEQQQQGAAASQVEEAAFASLVAGQARELIQRQRSSKREALQYEATKSRVNNVRMKAVKQDLKAKSDFIKAYDESMQQLRGADQQFRQQDLTRRKGMVETQHEFQTRLVQAHKEKAYVPGSGTEGPAAALLKQLSLGMLGAESPAQS